MVRAPVSEEGVGTTRGPLEHAGTSVDWRKLPSMANVKARQRLQVVGVVERLVKEVRPPVDNTETSVLPKVWSKVINYDFCDNRLLFLVILTKHHWRTF